ncbi:MAG: tyrosine-protein phosphatase [Dehalococcoidia bacterium]|nr:tyrosine-protein phosphatase [Dehalococcoidia bacterium]
MVAGTCLPRWPERSLSYMRHPSARAQLKAGIDALAGESSLPAVFHCSQGKDRTGMFAAIVLGVLGVLESDIAADFALSARYYDPENFRDLLAALAAQGGEGAELAKRGARILAQTGAPPAAEAMLTLLEGVRAEFGSMRDYALGIGSPRSAGDARGGALLGGDGAEPQEPFGEWRRTDDGGRHASRRPGVERPRLGSRRLGSRPRVRRTRVHPPRTQWHRRCDCRGVRPGDPGGTRGQSGSTRSPLPMATRRSSPDAGRPNGASQRRGVPRRRKEAGRELGFGHCARSLAQCAADRRRRPRGEQGPPAPLVRGDVCRAPLRGVGTGAVRACLHPARSGRDVRGHS